MKEYRILKLLFLLWITISLSTSIVQSFSNFQIISIPSSLTSRYIQKDDKSDGSNLNLDELTPPDININIFQRSSSSTLFSNNPITKANNGPLRLWKTVKSSLPRIITGAWGKDIDDVGNDNPIGALYNIIFVRLPAIGMFCIYLKNVWEHHPLIMDLGYGPFEINPIIVTAVIFVILGPGPQLLSQSTDKN